MNNELELLQPYPFEKLRALLDPIEPPRHLDAIALSIGEPAHPPPQQVLDVLADNLTAVSRYPATRGIPELRGAISHWAQRRFKLGNLDPEHNVLPVSGTREALFSIAQAVVSRSADALVICPNPFYQIYEGAALLAGATPLFLNCTQDNGFVPDLDAVSEELWRACQLFYLCSPGNPSGAVATRSTLTRLLELADRYDFVIASDECYSEIYADESSPPVGLLQVCAETGRHDFRRCLVFHSLSKRSNLPGLRSGFVAGDSKLLDRYLLYRTYHGCAMPLHHQMASIAAWQDEAHVVANRAVYREKFRAVVDILSPVMEVTAPPASFYLWPRTPVPGRQFALELYRDQAVTVLPGEFISRGEPGQNPGADRVRMALVAPLERCVEAATRIRRHLDKPSL